MKNIEQNCFKLSTDFENSICELLQEINFVRKGKKGYISNVASAFDIEASSFYVGDKKCATMYAWVFGINGKCIRGRFWWEFLDALKKVKKAYDISPNKRFVIYIHNLSYEFQFMKNYFEWEKVFSVDNRKPLYAIAKDGFEFRCSYLLSGYSLKVLGENLTKYKVEKLIGDLDYNLIRHSYTPLTEKEWGYILNDGLVVMAHIQEEIERLGSLAKLPLTKTGYVRDLCRDKCLKGANRYDFTKLISLCTMSVDNYKQLKRAYTGGFTHANAHYVDKLYTKVSSFDFTSSYPTVMVSEKFPMGKAIPRDVKTNDKDFYMCLNAYCCMFDIKFYNISSKVPFENYISISRTSKTVNPIVNNGRIVEADSVELTLTEQDFFIIEKLYEWDRVEISNFNYYKKMYLPKDLVMAILELYKDKTELKGVKGKEVEYLVAKGMINSIYGMSVTDPCKDESIYDGEWRTEKSDLVYLINNYNCNKQRFLFYAWGVWVTAYSRRNLFSGILEFKMDYLYSDTDSLKVINKEKHKKYIENYNKEITEKINKCLDYHGIPREMACPKTIKGVSKPLGVWDYEGTYDRFKTLGAKRYMTENDGEITITIAGVNKNAGIKYLKHTYGSNENVFKAFEENLYFPSHYDCDGIDENGSGKLCHTYIDNSMSGWLIDYMGNESPYYELSGVHMENTDYTLGLEANFKKLLLGIKEGHLV